jgi:hypothetical protein
MEEKNVIKLTKEEMKLIIGGVIDNGTGLSKNSFEPWPDFTVGSAGNP